MTSKAGDRKGPWHHAAVAALQGASIEEQLEYLDPDQLEYEEVPPLEIPGPALGLGALTAGDGAAAAPAAAKAPQSRSLAASAETFGAAVPSTPAEIAAARTWYRWDVFGRGRVVRR